jgi:hypothetical protein
MGPWWRAIELSRVLSRWVWDGLRPVRMPPDAPLPALSLPGVDRFKIGQVKILERGAAKIGGVGLQIIRDWVMRFNARGPARGLRPLGSYRPSGQVSYAFDRT